MITLRTLFAYLLGSGRAARRVAGHPKSLWIGLGFVLAAGFAREYDGEDLLRDPWHLGLPIVASVLTSLLLYVILRVVASPAPKEMTEAEPAGGSFWDGYPAFLRLYWWTAPLALLYAIPLERMMGPAEATRANLALLGLVSCWRVLLITRAVAATWRAGVAVFFPVMLFADGVALLLLFVAPLPLLTLMGGVRMTESESVLREVANWIFVLGIFSAPIWLVGIVVAGRRLQPRGLMRGARVEQAEAGVRTSRPLIAVTVLMVLGWIPVLPFTQPPQQRRRAVEAHLEAGRIEAALDALGTHGPEAFPPHWDPPPRPGYGGRTPDHFLVLTTALERNAPYWFVALYGSKCLYSLTSHYGHRRGPDEALGHRLRLALQNFPAANRLEHDVPEFLPALEAHARGDDQFRRRR